MIYLVLFCRFLITNECRIVFGPLHKMTTDLVSRCGADSHYFKYTQAAEIFVNADSRCALTKSSIRSGKILYQILPVAA